MSKRKRSNANTKRAAMVARQKQQEAQEEIRQEKDPSPVPLGDGEEGSLPEQATRPDAAAEIPPAQEETVRKPEQAPPAPEETRAPAEPKKKAPQEEKERAEKPKQAAERNTPSGGTPPREAEDGYTFQAMNGPLQPPGPEPLRPARRSALEEVGYQRPSGDERRTEAAPSAKRAADRRRRRTSPLAVVAVLCIAAGLGYSVRMVQEGMRQSAAALASASASVSAMRPENLSAGDTLPQSEPAVDRTATEPNGAIGILRLANTQHPLPDGYEPPELVTVDGEGRQLDARAAKAFARMVEDARKDGCNLVICSGYRSYERQEELFTMMIVDYLNLGYSYGGAYAATKSLRNVPGTSEHQTGLAADIVANDYWTLDDGYAQTDEAKWLKANAAKYGFILRYPQDKEDITGTHFEPWHYRYVGVEDAVKIMEQGLCLEEYLGETE